MVPLRNYHARDRIVRYPIGRRSNECNSYHSEHPMKFSIYLIGHVSIEGTAPDEKRFREFLALLGSEVVRYTINGITYNGLGADHYE